MEPEREQAIPERPAPLRGPPAVEVLEKSPPAPDLAPLDRAVERGGARTLERAPERISPSETRAFDE